MDVAISRREEKKRGVRAAIVKAALELFTRRGFESTTMDEIAERAGVSRRTVFRYFATKEALTAPGHQARLLRFEQQMAGYRPGDNRYEALIGALLLLAEDYMQQREEVLKVQRIIDASPAAYAYERGLDRDWEQAFERALLAGRDTPRARRRSRVLAAALMGVIRATLRDWVDSGGEEDLRVIGRANLQILEGALNEYQTPGDEA